MAEAYHKKLIEPEERVIFDKRHSLWEIWKNFLLGAGAIVALVLLQTRFKPGPSSETNWGYIMLISALALFLMLAYGAWPLWKRRKLVERKLFFPVSILVLAAGAWVALFWFRNSEGFSRLWSALVWIAFVVVIVGWLIYPIFAWFFAHFVLTDRRLLLSTGILNKKTMALPLEMLNDIKTSQNMWERLFNYGDVVMETAGEFGQQPFTNIGKPLEVKKLIFEQRRLLEEQRESMASREMAQQVTSALRAATAPTAPAAAPRPETSAGPGVVEQLEKLTEMHRAGELDDEEFKKAKEELLDESQDK
jgi:membrane protein YdbS with pleckstrin-like domain